MLPSNIPFICINAEGYVGCSQPAFSVQFNRDVGGIFRALFAFSVQFNRDVGGIFRALFSGLPNPKEFAIKTGVSSAIISAIEVWQHRPIQLIFGPDSLATKSIDKGLGAFLTAGAIVTNATKGGTDDPYEISDIVSDGLYCVCDLGFRVYAESLMESLPVKLQSPVISLVCAPPSMIPIMLTDECRAKGLGHLYWWEYVAQDPLSMWRATVSAYASELPKIGTEIVASLWLGDCFKNKFSTDSFRLVDRFSSSVRWKGAEALTVKALSRGVRHLIKDWRSGKLFADNGYEDLPCSESSLLALAESKVVAQPLSRDPHHYVSRKCSAKFLMEVMIDEHAAFPEKGVTGEVNFAGLLIKCECVTLAGQTVDCSPSTAVDKEMSVPIAGDKDPSNDDFGEL